MSMKVELEDGREFDFKYNDNTIIDNYLAAIEQITTNATNEFYLTSFDKSYQGQDKISSIVEEDNVSVFLVRDIHPIPSNSERYEKYQLLNFAIENQINISIREMWNKYDHSTCTLFGYLTQTEVLQEGETMETTCQKAIQNLQKGRRKMCHAGDSILHTYG